MKNHKDYSIIKNPKTTRVREPPTGRKGPFAAHDFESRSSANSATLAGILNSNAKIIIVASFSLVKIDKNRGIVFFGKRRSNGEKKRGKNESPFYLCFCQPLADGR
jgi:hypothetical protein